MTLDQPSWHPYDPGEPSDVAFENDCSLLVLLATPAAREAEWAERAAVSLARGWAEDGRRVFLADLALSRPRLHAAFGEANGEGMSDVLLYGASLKRIARAVPEGFLYAPTGTPVLDTAVALGSPRWPLLADGFAKAGAQLIAFLPTDEPGREALLAQAGRIVVLSGGDGPRAIPAGVEVGRVTRVLLAPRPAAPRGKVYEKGATPSPTRVARAGAEDLREALVAEMTASKTPSQPPPPAPLAASRLAPEPVAEEPERNSTSVWLVAAALLAVVLVVVILAVRGVIQVPGISP